MAFMHSKTFDIINSSNIDGYLDDYFEIDDYIAKPIQILNLKGYGSWRQNHEMMIL